MTTERLHLVNVWTDEQAGQAGFTPMPASLLWLPDGYSVGQTLPAFIFLHRWGGYPYDPLPSELGPELARRDCAFLSLCLRRRGMEGQLAAVPDNDLRDIKLAIDYLHTNGFSRIVLVGEEIGCTSALNYLSRHHDRRVAGAALLRPMNRPADCLRAAVGDDLYTSQLRLAVLATRQGAGMDVRIDFLPAQGPQVTQQALAFMAWWGPAAELDLATMESNAGVPVQHLQAEGGSVAHELEQFIVGLGGDRSPSPELELLRIGLDGRELSGMLWTPAKPTDGDTAVMLIHGLTSTPLSPLLGAIGPLLARQGIPALAPELRRSGWAGHETALLDWDTVDIDGWMEALIARGYTRIVLAGASIGSLSVGRYHSLRQHPNVIGVAHLMPTADCPDWFRAAAGDEAYRKACEFAATEIAAGEGDKALVDVDIRQPPPNKYGGRFRWTQRAASWLSWWGPDADSRNSVHISAARVPLLLLSGTEDSYNDKQRFAELRAAAVNAPRVDEIWYPDIDHGLAGVEAQVARDLLAWIETLTSS